MLTGSVGVDVKENFLESKLNGLVGDVSTIFKLVELLAETMAGLEGFLTSKENFGFDSSVLNCSKGLISISDLVEGGNTKAGMDTIGACKDADISEEFDNSGYLERSRFKCSTYFAKSLDKS